MFDHNEVTFMNRGNAFIRHITKDAKDMITGLDIELQLEGDVKTTSKKFTWLVTSDDNLAPVDLVSFDYLITEDKLKRYDELEDFLTPVTESRIPDHSGLQCG
ncbi:hypothetical protein F5Y15DRAFT_414437 [Xylariaceae sp. FL0016]|nr:hypothetical protein F5Y15DRAFT_414437 [Xylariaceae sp. FL0016]